jgi:hypothetical protein
MPSCGVCGQTKHSPFKILEEYISLNGPLSSKKGRKCCSACKIQIFDWIQKKVNCSTHQNNHFAISFFWYISKYMLGLLSAQKSEVAKWLFLVMSHMEIYLHLFLFFLFLLIVSIEGKCPKEERENT